MKKSFFSIKEMKRLRKEINTLLSKGMSNIYLKVTIETFSKLRFSGFKKFVARSDLGSSNSRRYYWILKLLVATQISDVWEQNCLWLFCYFNFERSYDVLKSKSPCILLSKNKNFDNNETESRMEDATHSFREISPMLQFI